MVLVGLLPLPLAGLVLLLPVPALDVRWEHHPSHFWLVLSVALVNMVLGLLTSEAASQRRDSRLFLVSLALLSSAGFLALHALATPGVLLEGPNAGFQIATPIGLVLAAVFAAASAWQREGHDAARPCGRCAGCAPGCSCLIAAWAIASFGKLEVLHHAPGEEAPPILRLLAPVVGRAVRVRCGPVPDALPRAQADVAARGRRRVRAPGGGDDRGGVRAQLARHVVGVARVDGRRVRGDPVRRQRASTGASAR